MKKRMLISLLIIIVFVIFFSFIVTSQTNSTNYQKQIDNKDYLESLKLKANVECLQNSQCSENFECIKNNCINEKDIDVCKYVSLSTTATRLKPGIAINSGKLSLSESDLPNILEDGKIIEIIDGNLTKHLYSPSILIGENKIEKENYDYIINKKNDIDNIITYRFAFSSDVDFSSKNIQGQALRILGEEYIIGYDSTNSVISLISNKKEIKLEQGQKLRVNSKGMDGTSVNIIRGKDGNVAGFEIPFDIKSNLNSNKDNIKVNEQYVDSVFNSIKLSFNNANEEFADIIFGGNC